MHISKRGTSYYLKDSQWIDGKVVSTTKYLGKNIDAAMIKLEELVEPYNLLKMQDVLRETNFKPPSNMKQIKKYVVAAEKLAQEIDDDELRQALNDLLVMLESRQS